MQQDSLVGALELLGAIAGMARGSVDAALMWLADLFLALPQLPLLQMLGDVQSWSRTQVVGQLAEVVLQT